MEHDLDITTKQQEYSRAYDSNMVFKIILQCHALKSKGYDGARLLVYYEVTKLKEG